MQISKIFIERPIGTTLLMFALFFFGIYSYHLLPVSQLPDVYFPTIVVNATLPGASPETMSNSVATPLEKRFSAIAGIDSISSSNSQGSTQITLQFALNKNIDSAALDVQAAIAASAADLPSNMLHPPVYVRINPAEAPVLYLSMYSDTEPLFIVDKYAEKLFGQKLSMINGVAQVSIYGSQKYATRISLNPIKLSTYQLSILEVKQMLSKANINLPTGNLSGKLQELPIKVNSQLYNVKEYQELIVAYRNGAPIKLKQIGTAIDSVENNKVASWFNDKRSIILAIQRQPGTNTIEVVKRVHNELAKLSKQLPESINVVTMYDRAPAIELAVKDVEHTLLISAFLVIIVIFIFLRNIIAAMIISLVLPLSIIGTFAFMQLLGFSLNIISLLALTLVVGFVVDDAIVVLENIMRHLEKGETPINATLLGVKEIGFTVVSITLSLVIVFIPILFMGGILGKLFNEFAITTIITILLSGLISLSLTPMLASKWLKMTKKINNEIAVNTTNSAHDTDAPYTTDSTHAADAPHPTDSDNNNNALHKIFYFSENIFNLIFNCYKISLNWSLQHKKIILYAFLTTILFSLILFKSISKGFIPDQDIGNFIAFTEADADISFSLMTKKQKQIAEIIKSHPDIENIIYNVGASGLSQTLNSGFIIVKLKPYKKRNSVNVIIKQLREKINIVPGVKVFLQNIPIIPIGAKMTKGVYQYLLLDPNIKKLQESVALLQKKLELLPELQDVNNDLRMVVPQIIIKVNREKAAFLEVSMENIINTLYAAFGSSQISTLYTESDTYKVILEIDPSYNDRDILNRLEVRSNNGNLIPLGAIVTLEVGDELLTINHNGQIPAATISFNLKPGKSLSEGLNAIENLVSKLSLPDSLTMQFSGAAETFKSAIKNLIILICMVFVIIYILLGILYESFIHPLTVLSGLPAAFFGALFTLFVFRIDLDLYGFIGLVILMGIVKKNAIMMVDFALEHQRHYNSSSESSIYNACLIRFRPIMMTTICAILSALPISLGIGSVAIETQRSLGVAVIGGLIFSQFLTLYITPVIYLYLDQIYYKSKTNIN